MKKGSSLMRGSLCPHYSKGLPVQGAREAGPWGSVINLSLSDGTAAAEREEAAPRFQRQTNEEEGTGSVNGTAREMTGNGKT